MGQRFAAMLAELPDELKLGPVNAAITRSFERRQADARDVALAALDSDRYLALHDWIDALIADPPVTARVTRKAKRELPKSVQRAYHRVESQMASADRKAYLNGGNGFTYGFMYATEAAARVERAENNLQGHRACVVDEGSAGDHCRSGLVIATIAFAVARHRRVPSKRVPQLMVLQYRRSVAAEPLAIDCKRCSAKANLHTRIRTHHLTVLCLRWVPAEDAGLGRAATYK